MSDVTNIISAIKARLETITKLGGFNTDAGDNVIIGRRTPDQTELPILCVFDIEDDPDEAERYLPEMMITLTTAVEAYVNVGTDPMTAVHNIIDDIKTAVLDVTDRTLGGLTLDFGYGGREIQWPEDAGTVISVRVLFVCLYRETYGAP